MPFVELAALGGRPTWPVAVDFNDQQARGLVSCYECSSGVLLDLVGHVVAPTSGAAGVSPYFISQLGAPGLRVDATSAVWKHVMRPNQQLTVDATTGLTFDAWVWVFGTPSANAYLCGSGPPTNTGKFANWYFYSRATQNLGFGFNNAGTFASLNVGAPPAVGLHHWLVTLRSGAQALYVDAVSKVTGTGTSVVSYAATDIISIGDGPTISGNANIAVLCMRLWNRVLSHAEIQALYHPQSRWNLLRKL